MFGSFFWKPDSVMSEVSQRARGRRGRAFWFAEPVRDLRIDVRDDF